ncbi:uncharacterized protein LOC142979054 [Anticarsia gemmatalis]|uniref:uncharacterized protein LOC142979054 n=1 Tax=Anticarsia gemmatalis TaxID=129554 RepID=UPI003F767580
MYDSGIFVFGAKTFFEDTKRHAIFTLPLEIIWKIFSYLDDISLCAVGHAHKKWARIISANRKLRNRLNKFELAIKLGSASLATFYRKNKRKMRKLRGKNYLPLCKTTVISTEKVVLKNKRGPEECVVYTKRFKLF